MKPETSRTNMLSTQKEPPETPAAEMMRTFAEGIDARPRRRKCWPNPPEVYTITLPSCINVMDPHAGDDYEERSPQ